jgi:uncharacterized protein YecT (DUF1311 family)
MMGGRTHRLRFALHAGIALACCAQAANAACPGQTQMEMNECAVLEYQAADAALNAQWANAKSHMDGSGLGDVLLDAQRKWIAFRDAACAAEAAPYAGGSIQPLIYYSCATRLTRARTQDLGEFRF